MTDITDEFSQKAENAAANIVASNMPFIKKALANSEVSDKQTQNIKVKVELDIERNENGVINIIPKLNCNITHKHEQKMDMIIIDPNTPDMFE